MRIAIAIVGLAALIVAGWWAWHARTWDAYAALAAIAFAVVSAGLWERRANGSSVAMKQRVGAGGIAIQSGRNTVIGSRKDNPHA
jgi:hypothetical protein